MIDTAYLSLDEPGPVSPPWFCGETMSSGRHLSLDTLVAVRRYLRCRYRYMLEGMDARDVSIGDVEAIAWSFTASHPYGEDPVAVSERIDMDLPVIHVAARRGGRMNPWQLPVSPHDPLLAGWSYTYRDTPARLLTRYTEAMSNLLPEL